jgi:hypothetical protein
MGLLDKIKSDVAKSGSNKGKFIYFREGQKVRVRFLNDMDEGMEVKFHDSFERGINVPCQEIYGKDCPYCEDEDLRTRSQYIWSVYDYEAKEVKLFMFAVNNCSPIPALMALYETYGTLTDRDYVISVTGKQQNKSFTVVPMDKNKFRNEKAKAYSEKAILKMLAKAFPADESEDEDEDYEEEDEKSKKKPAKSSPKKKPEPDDDDWDDEDDDVEQDYTTLTPKELYSVCKDRDIECFPKKPAKYYINLLKEYDKAQDDWGDEADDDDWEEDDG